MESVEDLLATIFLASMAVLVVVGCYLYQGVHISGPDAANFEPAAKLLTIPAKP